MYFIVLKTTVFAYYYLCFDCVGLPLSSKYFIFNALFEILNYIL